MLLYFPSAGKAGFKSSEEILMDTLADKLTRYIIKKEIIDQENYGVYRYGMLTGLEMALCMAICTSIAIYLKSFFQFMVLIAVFFSLRAYVGGLHLKRFTACLACSCAVITLLLVAARSFIPDLHLALGVTVIMLLAISVLAPLATRDRTDEEAAFFAKQRIRILIIITILDGVFVILGLKEFWSLIMYALMTILLSMVLGIVKKWKEMR